MLSEVLPARCWCCLLVPARQGILPRPPYPAVDPGALWTCAMRCDLQAKASTLHPLYSRRASRHCLARALAVPQILCTRMVARR